MVNQERVLFVVHDGQ